MIFALFTIAAVAWHLWGLRSLESDRRDHAFWREVAVSELLRRGPDAEYWL